MIDLSDYLNEKEAARRYELSESWFQRARRAGNGPMFIRVRLKIYYHKEKTDEWFEKNNPRSHRKVNALRAIDSFLRRKI